MKFKKTVSLLLAGCMAASMAACGNGGDAKNSSSESTSESSKSTSEQLEAKEDDSEPVEINYATFMVGSHLSAKAEAKVIEEFNKEYEGKIKVNIEELPSDSAYIDKMKTLAASKALPDVVIGKEGIRELAVKNGQAVDLIPYLEADKIGRAHV